MVQLLWRIVRRCLRKLKTELPYDPAVSLLSMYLEKNMVQKDTCPPVFRAALFTLAKIRKQAKCPSASEQIKKMWKKKKKKM